MFYINSNHKLIQNDDLFKNCGEKEVIVSGELQRKLRDSVGAFMYAIDRTECRHPKSRNDVADIESAQFSFVR